MTPLEIEELFARLPAKRLVKVLLALYDCPNEGRLAAIQALRQFGHRVPDDIWAFASAGRISDRQLNSPGSWIVEFRT